MTDSAATRRRADTTRRLLESAEDLFAERGITASSVEQICERAGFTRGAFYSNFASKDELFVQLLAIEQQSLNQRVQQALAMASAYFAANPGERDLAPLESIDRALRVTLAAYYEADEAKRWARGSMVSLESVLYAVREPAVREAFLEHQQGMLAPLGLLIEQVLGLCGLRLTLTRDEAATVLIAVFHAASRRALTDVEGHRVVDLVASRFLVAVRCMSEPAEAAPAKG